MILTVMIGNRTISFALFEEGSEATAARPGTTFGIAAHPTRTADEYAALLSAMLHQKAPEAHIGCAIIASVVPPLTGEICRALHSLDADIVCLTVGAGLRSGLTIRTDAPADLGADLVAMAAGALALQKPPFLVLNCDAVTTLSAVGVGKDAPAFLGCSILPGPALSVDALRSHAAQLPAVALSHPNRAIGTNTGDSVRAGILLGHAAAIEGLIARFEAEIGTGPLPVIVTGEGAESILPLLGHMVTFDGDLAHRGLYRLALLNARKVSKNTVRV
ncbi:MAG: type III pantothenate kinase [Clostridia bacterium]|nr:type III pantothenate kinase [Clostridia bacterium]